MRFNRFFIFKIIFYGILIYFIYLLVLITIQYFPINYKVAFLSLKQVEIKFAHYKLAFFSHVYSSIIIIIVGLTQFSRTIKKYTPLIHRFSGKVYVILTLCIASPSGLIMAFYANGGVISKISFSLLSIMWFVFTFKAYKYIKVKDYQKHEDYMIRSYALTLSAISLRLFKYGIVTIFGLGPMDTYKIVSILGWTLNLVIAEIYIRKR